MNTGVTNRSDLFAPEKIVRDDYGMCWHPDLTPVLLAANSSEDDDDVRRSLKAAGFACLFVEGDEDAFPDQVLMDGGNHYWDALKAWEPAAEGEGWKLAAICDSEDGPQALFVRELFSPLAISKGEKGEFRHPDLPPTGERSEVDLLTEMGFLSAWVSPFDKGQGANAIGGSNTVEGWLKQWEPAPPGLSHEWPDLDPAGWRLVLIEAFDGTNEPGALFAYVPQAVRA